MQRDDPTRAEQPRQSSSSSDTTSSDAASSAAQLASVATALAELTDRIVSIADQHRTNASNTIAPELDEVERALLSGRRKLDRLLRRLR